MKISEIIEKCQLKKVVFTADHEVNNGYCGDLMSDVMANAQPDSIWITIQAHKNSIAVALIKDIKAIIFTNNVSIHQEVIKKAKEERINLFQISKDSFTVSGEIYSMLEAETKKD